MNGNQERTNKIITCGLLFGTQFFSFMSRFAFGVVEHPALRHRIILGFEADAEGVTTDKLIHDVVATTPEE